MMYRKIAYQSSSTPHPVSAPPSPATTIPLDRTIRRTPKISLEAEDFPTPSPPPYLVAHAKIASYVRHLKSCQNHSDQRLWTMTLLAWSTTARALEDQLESHFRAPLPRRFPRSCLLQAGIKIKHLGKIMGILKLDDCPL